MLSEFWTCPQWLLAFGDHPSIFYPLSRVRLWGQQPEQGSPDFPLLSHVPRTAERHSPSSVSWVFLGPSTGGMCPERLTREGGILTRCQNHLIWLLSARRCRGSTPSSSWMAECRTLSINTCRVAGPLGTNLFFRSLPKACDHRWG